VYIKAFSLEEETELTRFNEICAFCVKGGSLVNKEGHVTAASLLLVGFIDKVAVPSMNGALHTYLRSLNGSSVDASCYHIKLIL